MKKKQSLGFKHWTTKKLKEVINEPYHRGTTGKDYAGFIDELQDEFDRRMVILEDEAIKRQIREYEERGMI